MDSYNNFALVYDRLMRDVDYKKATEYLCRLFEKHGKMPTLLLDVACGTGGFSNEFCDRGIEVIGIDASPEMLNAAKENANDRRNNILLLCQRAEELDLYGTVDGAVCCLDSLNHITDYRTLCLAFERIALFLEKDGLFIFDVNTVYKHKTVLGNHTFVIDEDDLFCVWQNTLEEKERLTAIDLDFFVKTEDGKYVRSSESFDERAYTVKELNYALTAAGLQPVAVYDYMTENEPEDDAERILFVTKK